MKSRIVVLSSLLWGVFASVAFAADVAPQIDAKSCEPPKYPKAALLNEEQGTVSLGFLIAVDGKVADTRVDKSSGSKSLDKAAGSALSQCKFKPGTTDGKPAQLWAKVDFTWKLE